MSPVLLFRTVMFSDLSVQKEGSSLLCRPASEDQGPVFERTSLAYSQCSERYRVGERSFSRQYAHIYAARLMQMRPLLSERAQQKWGKPRAILPTYIRDTETFYFYFLICFFFCSVSVRIRCGYQEAVWSRNSGAVLHCRDSVQAYGLAAIYSERNQWGGWK